MEPVCRTSVSHTEAVGDFEFINVAESPSRIFDVLKLTRASVRVRYNEMSCLRPASSKSFKRIVPKWRHCESSVFVILKALT